MATAGFSLHVPAPEDTMEMSSPASRVLDDDIDLDFDTYPGDAPPAYDENMLEDGDGARPATATDEMMDDDDRAADATVVEAIMQDEPVTHQEDEDELIDYGDEEYQEYDTNHSHEGPVESAGALLAPTLELSEEPLQVEEKAVNDPVNREDNDAATVPPADAVTSETVSALKEPNQGAETAPEAHVANEDRANPAGHYDLAGNDDEEQAAEDVDPVPEQNKVTTGRTDEPGDSEPQQLTQTPQQPDGIDTSFRAASEGPLTPTDTGLHPMTLYYNSVISPLFKSRSEPDGLLKDDNLASVSLAELMQNCRLRIATKRGENISEDQDFHLRFDQLGLILVEDSRSAFEISLNDVLEVYLQLHQNAGTQDVPTLELHLSLYNKCTADLSILKQAASEGQGIHDIPHAENADEFEYANDYDANAIERAVQDEGETGDYHGDAAPDGYDLGPLDAYEGEGEEYRTDQDQQDAAETTDYEYQGQEYHEVQDDEGNYQEEYDHADGEEPLSTTVNHETDQVGSVQDNDQLESNVIEGEAAEGEEEDQNYQTSLGAKAASTASSQTVRGDSGNDSTGEYFDEDLIDWDDDTLIDEVSEAKPKPQTRSSVKDDAQQNLNADAEYAAGDQVENVENTEYYNEDVEHEAEQYSEATFDQTDQPDHDENNYHFGEEDEQFHTAFDILEEGYEETTHDYGDNAGEDETDPNDPGTAEAAYHDEDEIGFDDDGEIPPPEQFDEALVSKSPAGKRSFDDLTELEEFDHNEPEPKKPRAG